jgi:hypothetical protein
MAWNSISERTPTMTNYLVVIGSVTAKQYFKTKYDLYKLVSTPRIKRLSMEQLYELDERVLMDDVHDRLEDAYRSALKDLLEIDPDDILAFMFTEAEYMAYTVERVSGISLLAVINDLTLQLPKLQFVRYVKDDYTVTV